MSAKRIARAIDTAKFKALYLLCGQQLDKKMRNNPKRWNDNKFQSFTPQEELYEELTYELETLFNDTLSIDDLNYDHSLSILEEDTREEQERKKKQRQDDLNSFKDKLKSNENQQLGRSPENVSSKARSSKNNTSPGFDYVKTWKKAFAKAKETRTGFSDQIETETHLLPFADKLCNHRFDRFIWPAVQYRLSNPAMVSNTDNSDDREWITLKSSRDTLSILCNMLKKHTLSIIFNDGGMGKTAYSWMLFEHLLHMNDKDHYVIRLEGIWPRSPDDHQRPLTLQEVLIDELRGIRILGHPVYHNFSNESTSVENADAITCHLRDKHVFILLDGFDQVTEKDRTAALAEIEKAIKHKSPLLKCHWLVSGRTFAFRMTDLSDKLARKDVLRCRLLRFDKEQQDEYFNDLEKLEFFRSQTGLAKKPLNFMCSTWRKEDDANDLGIPLHLAEIRKVIENCLSGLTTENSFNSLSAIHSNSDLLARVSNVYLQRTVEISLGMMESKDILKPKSPFEKVQVLRHVCSCLAIQMMFDCNYNASIDNGGTSLTTYRNLEKNKLVDTYLARSRDRFFQSTKDNYQYWEWAIDLLQKIEVTHRGDIDIFTPDCRAFRDRKVMEWYAAYYIVNHNTETDWSESINDSGSPKSKAWQGEDQWTRCWQLAMEMPVGFYLEEKLEAAINGILAPPIHGQTRPYEWMWFSWVTRIEQNENAVKKRVKRLMRATELIASFRKPFNELIKDRNETALNLIYDAERDRPDFTLEYPNQTDVGWYRRIPDKGDFTKFRSNGSDVVTVSPFWLRKFFVTVEEFCLFDSSHQSINRGMLPVNYVSGFAATMFCLWIGEGYRLPNVIEWESACRANQLQDGELHTQTTFWFGNDEDAAVHHAWLIENSGNRAHTLAESIEKKGHQNQFGLYDMLGNSWELCSVCQSGFEANRNEIANTSAQQLLNMVYVLVGGSYFIFTSDPRAAHRSGEIPRSRKGGFRIAFNPPEKSNS